MGEGILYIFEIYNTSLTKTDRPEPWFELKASDIKEMYEQNPFDNNYIFTCIRPYENCIECGRNDIINEELKEKERIQILFQNETCNPNSYRIYILLGCFDYRIYILLGRLLR